MFTKIVRVVTPIVLQTQQWIQEAIQIPRFPKSTFLSHGTNTFMKSNTVLARYDIIETVYKPQQIMISTSYI